MAITRPSPQPGTDGRCYAGRVSCGLLLVAVASAAAASAQPRVRLKANSRVTAALRHSNEATRLTGILQDDGGAPLAGRRLEIRAETSEKHLDWEARTGGNGEFSLELPTFASDIALTVTFPGDALHGPSEVSEAIGAPVAVSFVDATTVLDLGHRSHRFSVALAPTDAADASGPVNPSHHTGALSHSVGPARVYLHNELGAELAAAETSVPGKLDFVVRSDALGPPGVGELVASAYEGRSRDVLRVVRYVRPSLSLASTPMGASPGSEVALRGRLTHRGGALKDKAIGIFADDQHVRTVLTRDHGRFEAGWRVPESTVGHIRMDARYASDAPWLRSANSPPLTLQVDARSITGLWWAVAGCLALTALLLAARWRLQRTRTRTSTKPWTAAGVRASRPRHLVANQRYVAGHVLRLSDRRPVLGAIAKLSNQAGTLFELSTDTDGGFRSPELTAGRWTLDVEATGFAIQRTRLQVPHRGQWSRMEVILQSSRDRVLAAYGETVRPMLPAADRWRHWTVREMTERVSPTHVVDEPVLVRLAELVERASYAAPEPDGAQIAQIERLTQSVRVERNVDSPVSPGQSGATAVDESTEIHRPKTE